MLTDPLFWAVAVPAVVYAGIAKGGFGSGPAFAATPILALAIEPAAAVGLMLPLLILMDVSLLRAYWGGWDRGEVMRLAAGAVPGTLIGMALFGLADGGVIGLAIGLVALFFVAYRLPVVPKLSTDAPRFSRRAAYFWGAVAGVGSFISHAGGPPVAVYLLGRGHSKARYQATTVAVFWIINAMKAVPYGVLGMFTAQTLAADLVLAPFAVLGSWLGVYAHRLVPERVFFAIAYVVLVIAGGRLVMAGLGF